MRHDDRDREFVTFVTAHRATLVGQARLLTAGDVAGAEDLVQATLTRLYVQWSRVRRADSPLAYVRRSLTNAFLDESRRAFRRREVGEHLSYDAAVADADESTRQVVLAALAELPPRQRAVVVLRHWLDLDVDQTAALLDCSPGTVKSQNSKALARMRSVLHPTLLEEIR